MIIARVRRGRVWLASALVALFLVQLLVNAVRPTVSYRALALGADRVDLGIIAASFAVLSFALAIPIGRLVDRHGEPLFVAVGAGLIACVCLATVVAGSVLTLALTQALLGLGQIMTVMGLQALIGNSDPARRDARFAVFTVVVSLGQLAGPTAAGLVSEHVELPAALGADRAVGTVVFALAAGVGVLAFLCALSLPRTGSAVEGPQSSAQERGQPLHKTIARVIRLPKVPHAMVTSVAVLSTIDVLVAYLPAYGEATGLSATTVGLLLSTRAGAGMIARILLVVLIRRVGRTGLLVGCTALPTAALALFPVVGATPALFVLIGLAGFGLGLGQPLSLTWVARAAPGDIRGTAIAVRLGGNRLGQIIVPALVGALGGAAGLAAVFFAVATMLAGSSALSATDGFDLEE